MSETVTAGELICGVNNHWMVLYQVSDFCADRTSKMAASAEHSLPLNPMEKVFFISFLETTKANGTKLGTNVHWDEDNKVCALLEIQDGRQSK